MKSYKEFIYIHTNSKVEIVNITEDVYRICRKSGIKEGVVLVFPFHTSAAVYISDSDFNLTDDYRKVLSKLIPAEDNYVHDLTDYKRNADAHLKSILTGHHITLPLSNGELDLGIYQTIYYAEFDGQRKKEVLVKIIGE
jgi:secondary thiamine-phosphate synthase enzyme